MGRIDTIAAFVSIAEQESFVGAARRLNRQKLRRNSPRVRFRSGPTWLGNWRQGRKNPAISMSCAA
jgi:hypothetical protein